VKPTLFSALLCIIRKLVSDLLSSFLSYRGLLSTKAADDDDDDIFGAGGG
jgi:hypothetical protein